MEYSEWWDHVDKVLEISKMTPEENIFYAALKQNCTGEYELGIEINELENILKGLKAGDELFFSFKPFSKWPKLFLSFIKKNTNSLFYVHRNRFTLESIEKFVQSCERYANVMHVNLKVIGLPIIIDDQTLKLLTLCLRQVFLEEVSVVKD